MANPLASIVSVLTPKRRWFQFSLKWLFLMTSALASVCWGYWYLWPAWKDYQEQTVFERASRELKAGMTADQLTNKLLRPRGKSWSSLLSHNSAGEVSVLVPIYFRSCWYCAYIICPRDQQATLADKMASREVRVYRLNMPPAEYRAQTKSAQEALASQWHHKPPGAPDDSDDELRRTACLWDFAELLNGRADTVVEIEHKLIHSDTPQSTDE